MKKLMLVDHDQTLCGLLARIMESGIDDLEVIVVRTHRDALLKARAVRPDIIIIDWQLPDGSGEDLLQEIVSILPDTYVIATSTGSRAPFDEPDLPDGVSTTLARLRDLNQLLGTVARVGSLVAGPRRRRGKARFSGDPASSPESLAFDHQAVLNKLSSLSAVLRAYGADLQAGAHDAQVLTRTVEAYTGRLGEIIQELSQLLVKARSQPHSSDVAGACHVHSLE